MPQIITRDRRDSRTSFRYRLRISSTNLGEGSVTAGFLLSPHEPQNAEPTTTIATSKNSAPKALKNAWLIAQGCPIQTRKSSNLFETSGDLPYLFFLFIGDVNEAAKYEDCGDG
jgi:hypothetical protein